MGLYVKVMFWLYVLGVVIRLVQLLGGFVPYSKEITVAETTGGVLLGCGFAVWTARVLGWL
jgi:hypothetical protein